MSKTIMIRFLRVIDMEKKTKAIVASVLIVLVFAAIAVSESIDNESDWDCNEWNDSQCLDESSEWFGCDVEEKVCYNSCRGGLDEDS